MSCSLSFRHGCKFWPSRTANPFLKVQRRWQMKLLTRVTLLALLFLLASTAAFADTFTIGELDLDNTIPGSSDQFDLTNLTGPGGPGTTTPLTFQNLALTINGTAVTLSSTTLSAGGFATLASNLLVNSITSFHL